MCSLAEHASAQNKQRIREGESGSRTVSAPLVQYMPIVNEVVFDAGGRDPTHIASESAELWTKFLGDHRARATLRRDGLDLSHHRLSGPHPFAFAPASDGTRTVVSVIGVHGAAADTLLDLFRFHFLRHLAASG